jgi:N-sulfoglucosamine sulfohydrolase
VVNLAGAPAQQAVKRELIEKLKTFQAATKDPWIHKWAYE